VLTIVCPGLRLKLKERKCSAKETKLCFDLLQNYCPLLLLLAIVCLDYNFKTTGWSFMTKLKERKCSAKEPELYFTE